ncbi:MAG: hypothetical protein ACRDID_20595, partial [Ktedonobacterales bacterium]
QSLIDHRFYRHKYHATRVVENFSASLRDEVDVDTLRERLLALLQETMEPEYVSLWMRNTITSNATALPQPASAASIASLSDGGDGREARSAQLAVGAARREYARETQVMS